MFYLEHIKLSSHGVEFRDKMGRTLSLSSAFKKAFNRMDNYLLDFELLIIRIAGVIPLYFVRWIVYSLAGVKIGSKAHLHMGTQFFNPSKVSIGEGSVIGQNAFLDGREKLTIGKYVDIASNVQIYNSEHDINSEDFHPISEPVEISDYVFIGPSAIILPGVKIGYGAVVAAGAVVTHDVADMAIVGGVPAKEIGKRTGEKFNYKLGRTRLFQ